MKTWKMLVCLLSILFFVLAGAACQQTGAAKSTELRGAIHKDSDGKGLYIRSGGKIYMIESQDDLSEMIGKTVSLQGTVSEKDGKHTIAASSVKAE